MKRAYRYTLVDAVERDELPAGSTGYEIYKDALYGYWGWVEYDHPLTGEEVDHYNLDGPLG